MSYIISSGESSEGIILQNNTMTVLDGGIATDTTVNSRGYLYVSSGGTANSTTVNSRGSLYISSGGVANSTTVNSYGYLRVSSGGTANSTTVNSDGGLDVRGGGTATDTTANSRGYLYVSNGGTANRIIENGGYVEIESGAVTTFVSNSFSGLELNSASATVHSGTTANKITVNSTSLLQVFSGGSANNTTVNMYGSMHVFQYGIANKIAISSGCLEVAGRGNINSTTIDAGGLAIVTGTAVNTIVNASAGLQINRGVASNTIINSSGGLVVFNGVASDTTVNSDGSVVISEGKAYGTILNTYGMMTVQGAGAITSDTVVNPGGSLIVKDQCWALAITENGGYVKLSSDALRSFTPNSFSELELTRKSATVHSGTTAVSTIINSRGRMDVFNGGIVSKTVVNDQGQFYISSGGTANNTTVNYRGSFYVRIGGIASSIAVNSEGAVDISVGGSANTITVNSRGALQVRGGTANNTTIHSGGRVYVSSGATLAGKLTFEDGAVVSAEEGVILDFDLTQVEAGEAALVNDLSIIQGAPVYTLTVNDDWKAGNYVYSLADGAENFASTISVVNTAGDELGVLTVGETVRIGYDDYTLNLNEGALTVTVEVPDLTPKNLVGTADGVSWDSIGADYYLLEYSQDDFAHVLVFATPGTAVDTLNLPGGTYQWRVKDAEDYSDDWAVGEPITSENDPGSANVVQSDGDGNDDLFFANACGVWETGYFAQHVGSIEDQNWGGTKEYAAVAGKNQLADIFEGSDDANILLLTDDANGDGLFVDDIFTELPGTLEEQQARIARIDEIRAGAGDDIVDMTSQRFEYIGEGILIRGGDGNDTIWANKGANWLFGDLGDDRLVGASDDDLLVGGAGDDRMHGGGGNDVFAFCENWGKDTVEQLAGGKVTLWFASGDESNWDEETLTYTDGTNSVKISGVSKEQIELKFGAGETPDDADQFASLSNMGAFEAFTTRKIFEEATLA